MKKNYSKVKSKCPSAGRVDILTANIKVGVTKWLGVHTWNPASTVLTRTGQFSFLNGQQNCNFVSGPLRLGPEEIMACVTKSKMLAKFCPIYQCCRLHWVTLSTILQRHQMWDSPNVKFHIRLKIKSTRISPKYYNKEGRAKSVLFHLMCLISWLLSPTSKLYLLYLHQEPYRLAKLYTGYMALGYIARHTWLYSHWLFSHIYMAI